MSKYIDADKLIAEIERRKEEYKEDRYMSDYRGQISYYKDEIYDDLLSFIDSLQQEQPCEDLKAEEEIEKYMDIRGLIWYDDINLSDFARHFYELGKQSKEPVNEDLEAEMGRFLANVTPSFKDGSYRITRYGFRAVARHFVEWQKQQLLKDAVEGVAEELYNDGEIHCTVGVGTYFKPGDEVYVIKKED